MVKTKEEILKCSVKNCKEEGGYEPIKKLILCRKCYNKLCVEMLTYWIKRLENASKEGLFDLR